jgi:hypothetical protein
MVPRARRTEDGLTKAQHAVAVGGIAALAASGNLLAQLSSYDGGLAGSAGTFLLHGELPYRDFWWLYGPGAPVVVGALTAILGPSVFLLRLLGLLLVGVQAALGYAFLRDRMPHLAAALIAISAVGMPAFVLGIEISAWSLALTLALAGVLIRSRGSGNALSAGLLIGAAFTVRFDVGAYALLAALAVGDRRRLLIGFTILAIPVVALAIATTPLSDLYVQLIWFPLFGTRLYRSMPLPALDSAVAIEGVIAAVIVPKVAIVLAAARLIQRRAGDAPLLVMTIFAGLCQLQTLSRADIFHQAQASLPGYLVLGWIAAGSLTPIRARVPRRQAYRRLGVFAGVAGACAVSLILSALSLPAAQRGPLNPDDRGLVAAIRTVIANTTRDQPVFVGLTEHRITLVNDVLAYYLADRRAGVRVAMFNPGVTNIDATQAEMVASLKASQTPIMLLAYRSAHDSESSNWSSRFGSTILDTYIGQTYSETCRFGAFRILARRDRSMPVRCAEERDDERLVDILGRITAP